MASRASRRRRRTKKIAGIMLLAVSLGIVTLFVLVFISAQGGREALEPLSLCPKDGEVAVNWIVLLDLTEPYNPTQQMAIKQRLEALRRELPEFGLIQFYLIDDSLPSRDSGPVLALCNPGSADSANPLIENPDQIRAFWEERYTRPIAVMVDTIIGTSEATHSPIMEMLQFASVSGLPVQKSGSRIIIVSDLLQNTTLSTQYGGQPPIFETFRQTDAFQRLRADLEGVEITLLYIRRHELSANRVQGRAHVAFWEAYFREQGASVSEIIRIPG